METIAIIAYRQPVTRAQVEAIRGVNSDAVIRRCARNLIETVGQLEQASRPELLGTTFEFLRYFGLESLDLLPRMPELEDSPRPSRSASARSILRCSAIAWPT